jgi:hypothetical protein
MKLERADLFSERNPMTLRMAQHVRAAFGAGVACRRCGQPATVRRGDDHYYCALDARFEALREQRAAMKHT